MATPLVGDNYIQETRIPTMHFQDSIPRLPIPVLKDTATRFLYAASPLISEAEMNETKKVPPAAPHAPFRASLNSNASKARMRPARQHVTRAPDCS